MPFCSKCGTFNIDGSRFCQNCGNPIKVPHEAQTAPADSPTLTGAPRTSARSAARTNVSAAHTENSTPDKTPALAGNPRGERPAESASFQTETAAIRAGNPAQRDIHRGSYDSGTWDMESPASPQPKKHTGLIAGIAVAAAAACLAAIVAFVIIPTMPNDTSQGSDAQLAASTEASVDTSSASTQSTDKSSDSGTSDDNQESEATGTKSDDSQQPVETKTDIPENPDSVDVSGKMPGKATVLYGVGERVNLTPNDTSMAWGAAVYYLDFERPVTITHNTNNGPTTKTYERIQFAIVSKNRSVDEHLAENPSEITSEYDQYVGKPISVAGTIMDAGTSYYLAGGAFVSPEINLLDDADPASEPVSSDDARKQANLETAKEFLELYYNNVEHKSDSDRIRRLEIADNGSLQSGWPATRNLDITSLEAVDEDTVEYTLTCDESMQMPGAYDWTTQEHYGTLTFTDESHVDIWYMDGHTSNRLIRS